MPYATGGVATKTRGGTLGTSHGYQGSDKAMAAAAAGGSGNARESYGTLQLGTSLAPPRHSSLPHYLFYATGDAGTAAYPSMDALLGAGRGGSGGGGGATVYGEFALKNEASGGGNGSDTAKAGKASTGSEAAGEEYGTLELRKDN